MRCPVCRANKPSVAGTVGWLDDKVARTRLCERCGLAFSTTETFDLAPDQIAKLRAEYDSRSVENPS